MQMSFQQFQITVTLYKLISFNSQSARLSWVTLVNITFWRRVVEPETLSHQGVVLTPDRLSGREHIGALQDLGVSRR